MTSRPSQFTMPDGRRISYIRLEPALQGEGDMNEVPSLMWLGGFRSQMRGGKADALHEWCASYGLGFTRFDYTGHGDSDGDFADCTISAWLEEARAVFHELTSGPVILVGSSMGAWLTLLLMRDLASDARARIKGAVLIAPAWDMTERLMWQPAPEETKAEIMEKGVWYRPSAYDDKPYPITRALIEDGRGLLVGDTPFDPGAPVHILHGLRDVDVPWAGSVELMENILKTDDVHLTLIKDGEHRLSRPQDLDVLCREVAGLVG